MFKYIIRRLLLIIPTFIGVTFLIFIILQWAPDGPFDRAIKQLKNQQNANQEVSTSSDVIGKSNELRPEVIEKLRAEYGLDRNIFIRYLMWIGLWPKDMNIKNITYYTDENNEVKNFDFYDRDKVDIIEIGMEKLFLQRWLYIEKDTNSKEPNFIISESGVGLEHEMPPIEKYIGEVFYDCNSNLVVINDSTSFWPGHLCEGDEYWKAEFGNNKYDYGENLHDYNNNDLWDGAEIFIDVGNKQYDIGEIFKDTPNGIWDENEFFVDCDSNGTWDLGEMYIDKGDTIWNPGEPYIDKGDEMWHKPEKYIDAYENQEYDSPSATFNIDKYKIWLEEYSSIAPLPSYKKIKTWFYSDWEYKENSYKEIYESFNDNNQNGKWDEAEQYIDKDNNGIYTKAEPFVDVGNGKWDENEPFIDSVDGLFQEGETFWDCNNNGIYDEGIDSLRKEFGNGIYDEGEIFTDAGNGIYNFGEKFTDINNNGIWDNAEAFTDIGNGLWDEGEEFTDINNNNKWDENEPFIDIGNNKWDDDEFFVDSNNSGKWDIEKINIMIVKKEFKGILNGYLGYSKNKGSDVSDLIQDRLQISAQFGLTSLLLVYLITIPLGIWKAIKNGSSFDLISSIIVFIGYSIPGYILGAMLIVWIGADGILPISGFQSPNFETLSFFNKILNRIEHFILPGLCYMVGAFAVQTILMKNSLLENLSQDYVRTAFAKGLSERRVIFFHAVRNSLIPLATGVGGWITVFLAGSFLIEKTFGIDGMGLLGYQALIDRDYDIIMGTAAISTVLGLLGNVISDIVYALVDPRIRFK